MLATKLFLFIVFVSSVHALRQRRRVLTSDLVQEHCKINGTLVKAQGWCRVLPEGSGNDLVLLHTCNSSCNAMTGACQVDIEDVDEECQVIRKAYDVQTDKLHDHLLGRCRYADSCKWKPLPFQPRVSLPKYQPQYKNPLRSLLFRS